MLRNDQDIGQLSLALIGPAIVVWPFFIDLTPPQIAMGWLVNWSLVSRHNYILHNHVHRPFSTSKIMNRVLDLLLGFTTGMSAGNWKITHVHGHHAEHIAAKLPNRPRLKILETTHDKNTRLSHNIGRALVTTPAQISWPFYIAFKLGFLEKGFRSAFYRFCFWEMAIILLIVGSLFFVDWKKTLIFIVGVHFLVIGISRYTDHITHSGANEGEEYTFANICLSPTFNRIFWNFGYHVAHHIDPRLHWTELKQAQERLPITQGSMVVPSVLGLICPREFSWRRAVRRGV